MRVLLTGATGFLGRAVARRLVDAGHTVAALVRDTDADLNSLGVEPQEGDLASLDAVVAAATGCDAVVHCAARVGPFARIDEYYDINVRGTDHVLAACEIADVRRLVFTSCAGVVIEHGDLNGVNESQRVAQRAPTAYLASKALAERHVLAANGPRFATIALRPHLLWGPGDAVWLPKLASLARAGRLRLFGEAGKKIDHCYIDNAADAHLAALERLEPGAAIAGKPYFITQGEPGPAEGFINGLLRAAGYPVEMRRLSAMLTRTLAATAGARRTFAGADPLLTPDTLALLRQATWFNIAAARRDLGYSPRVGTAEGLARLSAHLARERMRGR
jgi:nucleoside-diphosphate-sugar epimerase